MTTAIAYNAADLREWTAGWRREQLSVAVVPTMGALHQGHLSLVRAAIATADRVVVTIFVNPIQFDRVSDFDAYPRTEKADALTLSKAGAHLVYVPSASDMYPDGFATTVSVGNVSEGLCGAFRPRHFSGVAIVVAKLLCRTGADFAFFGEKDFQQLQVVRRLVRDLDLAATIIACPTVREPDGLAMSSRNLRLSPCERRIAPGLAEILTGTAALLRQGGPIGPALRSAKEELLRVGFDSVEYLEVRRDRDLAIIERIDEPARLLAAAWLGQTRLIDNMPIQPRPAGD